MKQILQLKFKQSLMGAQNTKVSNQGGDVFSQCKEWDLKEAGFGELEQWRRTFQASQRAAWGHGGGGGGQRGWDASGRRPKCGGGDRMTHITSQLHLSTGLLMQVTKPKLLTRRSCCGSAPSSP